MTTNSTEFLLDDHTTGVLEFARIRNSVVGMALSSEGARAITHEGFHTDRDALTLLHRKVRYLIRLFDLEVMRPRYSFPEIEHNLSVLRVEGGSLEAPSLLAIADYIRAARDLCRFAGANPEDIADPPLREEVDRVVDIPDLERFLRRHIDEEGNVREDLPELVRIGSRIKEVRGSLQRTAKRYLLEQRDIWQSDVPTIKDDRTVLPLKNDHRGSVHGIIREVSPTGATLFIEPEEIVEGNNQLSLLRHEYSVEIARILRVCTAHIREHRFELESLTTEVAGLDRLYARARYGESIRGVTPAEQGETVRIAGARHPMLGRSAVPIDVEFPDGVRILIITGPNAGGKTVTLKTIGLFSLMHQFGLPLPADDGSALPLFDGVFADIGDEQSIDESLSTFSGHMRNLSRFLEKATRDSLVLLDELGSGTDPEEGSAIAMAILDSLVERGATVVVTTHHNVLKNYGYTHEEAVNASVAFDTDTHRPTYRVIMGFPGESHAFDIAEASGLPESVVAKAHRYLDERSTDVATMIRAMSEKERDLERRHEEFDTRKATLLEKQREVDLYALRLKQRELELRTQGYRELSREMDQYRSRLEHLVKELSSGGPVDRDKTREVKEYIEDLENTAKREKREIEETRHEMRAVTNIEPGMEVYVGESRQRGRVVRKAKGTSWVVQTDKLRVTLPEHEIKGVAESKQETRAKVRSIVETPRTAPPAFQLDVRGMRLSEAISEVESHIDRCVLAGLAEFEVIHGHGEGVLKRGIHEFLSENRAISSFGFAHPEQGGFGKTVVKLGS